MLEDESNPQQPPNRHRAASLDRHQTYHKQNAKIRINAEQMPNPTKLIDISELLSKATAQSMCGQFREGVGDAETKMCRCRRRYCAFAWPHVMGYCPGGHLPH
jgi:hypothetical protein